MFESELNVCSWWRLEDAEAKRNINSEGQAHEASDGSKDSIKN